MNLKSLQERRGDKKDMTKEKKPIYKRAWFIILAVIVVIAIIGSVLGGGDSDIKGNGDSSKGDTVTEKEEEITYTAYKIKTLVDDLENNAASAKEKYDGKNIQLIGRLSNIDSDGSYISIERSNDSFDFTSIQCYIQNDEQLNTVKKLSKGDKVIVKGEVTSVGEILGYSLDIHSIQKKD